MLFEQQRQGRTIVNNMQWSIHLDAFCCKWDFLSAFCCMASHCEPPSTGVNLVGCWSSLIMGSSILGTCFLSSGGAGVLLWTTCSEGSIVGTFIDVIMIDGATFSPSWDLFLCVVVVLDAARLFQAKKPCLLLQRLASSSILLCNLGPSLLQSWNKLMFFYKNLYDNSDGEPT